VLLETGQLGMVLPVLVDAQATTGLSLAIDNSTQQLVEVTTQELLVLSPLFKPRIVLIAQLPIVSGNGDLGAAIAQPEVLPVLSSLFQNQPMVELRAQVQMLQHVLAVFPTGPKPLAIVIPTHITERGRLLQTLLALLTLIVKFLIQQRILTKFVKQPILLAASVSLTVIAMIIMLAHKTFVIPMVEQPSTNTAVMSTIAHPVISALCVN
jgi:hypothetical protein